MPKEKKKGALVDAPGKGQKKGQKLKRACRSIVLEPKAAVA
jgi:hypothetical protein